jgi:hypothetical protein
MLLTFDGTVTVVRPQPLNALLPMLTIFSGMVNAARLAQSLKRELGIPVREVQFHITDVRLVQDWNTASPKVVRVAGRVKLVSFPHSLKALSPMLVILSERVIVVIFVQ